MFSSRAPRLAMVMAGALMALGSANTARAAITWDSGGADSFWFHKENWSNNLVPPGSTSPIASGQNTEIDSGVTVDYDPLGADATNYAAAAAQTYPTNYGPTAGGGLVIWRLYLSSGANNSNTLNMKSGQLILRDDTIGTAQFIVGRTGAGVVNQTGGTFIEESNNIDLSSNQATGALSGTWNYSGGTVEAGLLLATDSSTGGIRLGPSTIAAGNPTPSTGTLRIANTGPDGHIRFKNVTGSGGSGNNGSVANFEFHYGVNTHGDGGVRPVQIARNLTFNNSASQSSRLNLVLDSAPETPTDDGSFFIPESIALFDADFSSTDSFTGTRSGSLFDATGVTQLNDGDTVSATFGGFTYNWTLRYNGLIGYSDINNSLVSSIAATGGNDIVLIGLSSNSPAIPEPASLSLIALGTLGLLGRRARA
jgi:hypothetical protein